MPRKKLVKPLFWQDKERKKSVTSLVIRDTKERHGECAGLMISPYSDFIPIEHLSIGKRIRAPKYNTTHSIASSFLSKLGHAPPFSRVMVKIVTPFIEKNPLLARVIHGLGSDKGEAYTWMDEYLQYDGMASITNMSNSVYSVNRKSAIPRCFNGDSWPANIGMRTWKGFTTPYSLYICGDDDQWSPLIVATVLPENYLYQKMRILNGQGIDLTRVIILVATETMQTGFLKKGAKMVFKQQILPELDKVAADVWYVPQSFIREKCFVQDYQLQSSGLLPRKREKEAYVKGFLKYLSDELNKTYSGTEVFGNQYFDGVVWQRLNVENGITITNTGTTDMVIGGQTVGTGQRFTYSPPLNESEYFPIGADGISYIGGVDPVGRPTENT